MQENYHGTFRIDPREARLRQARAGSRSRPGSAPGAARRVRRPGSGRAPAPAPIAVVDVVAQLEQRAAANPQKLNWKTSIVDLLKLLELDSSFAARKVSSPSSSAAPRTSWATRRR